MKPMINSLILKKSTRQNKGTNKATRTTNEGEHGNGLQKWTRSQALVIQTHYCHLDFS